jgi:hypothetical protein
VSHRPGRVVLLGPQRGHPGLGGLISELAGGGRVALITAGWQEWEDDDGELRSALGAEAINVRLYHRAEEVWAEDSELAGAHKKLQQDVRLLRSAYNLRLARAMEAWIEVQAMPGDAAVLDPEREAALASVRELDAQHAGRLEDLRNAFYGSTDPLMRASVGRQRHQVAGVLEDAGVVFIAGGHLPALLNRLRLFGVDQLIRDRSVVAASAGAMALTERVVLFHDTPPWGPGHAEVGEVGLGLAPGIVALPDADTRLRLGDPGRVARMARRFEPDACVPLDVESRVAWNGRWEPRGARRLTSRGTVEAWRPAA